MTGGIAESLHQLAEHLARHVPVTVMTSVAQDGTAACRRAYCLMELPPLPERKLGLRPGDTFTPIRKLHTGVYFFELRQHADAAASSVSRIGPQTVVIVGSWDTASHFWCAACRRAGLPYALIVNGAEVLLPLYGRLPEWRREDFVRADRVLANSRATADLAVERLGLPARPIVIHPSVSRPSDAEVIPRAAALRERLQLSKRLVLLSLGRLIRRKGFDLVMRAVAELSVEFPSLSYVIAGEGPERGALEELARTLGIADRIRMVGQVDDPTKWALYQLSDVFVMPNRLLDGTDWEGFGIVFVEAALSKRPSIAGRNGGTADAVADEESGLLVDSERQDELTSAIRRLLRDEALRRRLGETGERIARERFSGDVVAERVWESLGGAMGTSH